MKAKERRNELVRLLREAGGPLTASTLADRFDVSRQLIVGDVALLRAANHAIVATNQGYLLASSLPGNSGQYRSKIVCKHSADGAEKELRTIVSLGGAVEDIEVDHPVYGVLKASLRIRNEADVDHFIHQMNSHSGEMLSSLTNGIHLHTITTPTRADFEKIKQALADADILLSED